MTPDSATSPQRTASQGLLIANLIGQIAFGLLAMTICLPSMQEWGRLLDGDQATVQLTFSGYVLTYGAMQLVYGPLSDRLGRRRVLLTGLAVALAGSVLAALTTTLPALIAARVLQGAGSAAGMAVGRATVQDLFHGRERTRVMAYLGMSLGLCPPLATVIGGQMHVWLGWQSNFVLIAVLAVVLWVAGWWGLPGRKPGPPPATRWLSGMLGAYAQLGRDPGFRLSLVILAATVGAFYAFLAGAPIVLRSYGVGPAGIGWFVMMPPLAYIVGNFATSRLAHARGDRWLMNAGQALTLAGIGLMLVLAALGLRTPLAFAMPLMLLGLGHGLLVPACLAATVGRLPALAGAAAAAAGLAQQWVGALAGYLVGWVRHEDAANLGLLMLGFTLAAVAAQWALGRPSHRPAP